MKGLGDEALRILGMIESSCHSVERSVREGLELPKRLFEFGLVRREMDGFLRLTKSGERALFRARCVQALEGANGGEGAVVHAGVRQWLVNSGFVEQDGAAMPGRLAVTARGHAWLGSLASDAGPEAMAPTAEEFVRRRVADMK